MGDIEIVKILMMVGQGIWNKIIGLAVNLISQSPENTDMWPFIIQLAGPQGPLTAIGRTLVVLFFLVGFCLESQDPRKEMRLETIIKLFLRICIADFFVTQNINIFTKFYAIANGMASLIGLSDVSGYVLIPADTANALLSADFGFFKTIPLFLIAIILLLIIVGSAFMVLYEAYYRLVKVCMVVPFGAIVYSTIAAGSTAVSTSTVSYFKYVITTAFEVFTMQLAIKLVTVFTVGNSQITSLISNPESYQGIILGMAISGFSALMLVGIVKRSRELTHSLISS